MKRKGYILERIADMDNLYKASANAQKKKSASKQIMRHNRHKASDLRKLRDMILNLDFPAVRYDKMTIVSDAGKAREISRQSFFPFRVLHHAIMQVIGEDIFKSLIYDTSACIKGKGLHFGVKRMKMFIRRYPQYGHFVKTDLRKFYQSVPHDLVVKTLEYKYKDKRFIELIWITLLNYDGDVEIELENEREKKRSTNWGVHQSAARQLRA